MNVFFYFIFLLLYLMPRADAVCSKRATPIERKCRKSCKDDYECTAPNKFCLCDGDCGMTCYNPSADCDEPEEIPNGSFILGSKKMQSKVTYKCDRGYVLKGNVKRTCSADKKWWGAAPTCKRGCSIPNRVPNSFPWTFKTIFELYERVSYMCRTGYHMNHRDQAERTCTESGWTPERFYCSIQICSDLPTMDNAEILYSEGHNFGTFATLKCNKGYDPPATGTRVKCNARPETSPNGEWSGSLSPCIIKTCGLPKDPENGEVINRYWIVLEFVRKIEYRCNDGYKLEGPREGICDKLGTWGPIPKCAVDPDCDFSNYNRPTCAYANEGWDRYRTTEGSGFSGHVARAENYNSKLTSPVIPADWTSSEYICLKFDYYLLSGSLAINSVPGSENLHIQWQSHEGEVSEKWLDAILNIDATTSVQYIFDGVNPVVYLDNIEVVKEKCEEYCKWYTCENGGTCINRKTTYTCYCTIDFIGNNCETDIKCIEPTSTIRNGRLTSTNAAQQNLLVAGSTAEYSCSTEYKMRGYAEVVTTKQTTCYRYGERSYWYPDPSRSFVCVDIICTKPPLKDHQLIVGEKSEWRVDETVTVKCEGAYAFSESNPSTKLTCGPDERWNGVTTTCRDIKCKDTPKYILKGHRYYKSWLWWPTPTDRAIYHCDKNYKMYGVEGIQTSQTITCIGPTWFSRSRTHWDITPTEVYCIDIECSQPPKKHLQQLISSKHKWIVNTRATYRCEQGYEYSSGSETRSIQCKDDETWTDHVDECIEEK